MTFRSALLVEVFRGNRVESEHLGALVVCDPDGRRLASTGDPDLVTYPRSSLKPLQLLPLLQSGAADRFGFSSAQLAVMAASHAGEPDQVRAVASVLEKIGLNASALQCGVHPPANVAAAEQLIRNNQKPNALHNNCSGKHAGMLALAVHLEAPVESYLDVDHPVQIAIRETIARVTGVNARRLEAAIDGCSAPAYALSLRAIATAFARLAAADGSAADELDRSLARVGSAMRTHPALVAGRGRLDTILMESVSGLVSKGGAEGFQALGVASGSGRPALGIALKIADGEGRRAIPYVIPAVLQQLKAVTSVEGKRISEAIPAAIRNHRGTAVGEFRVRLTLDAGVEAG